jgi:hypothetical protein
VWIVVVTERTDLPEVTAQAGSPGEIVRQAYAEDRFLEWADAVLGRAVLR